MYNDETRKEFFMKKVGFALLAMMVVMPALAATSPELTATVCALAEQFGDVFNILRILAFIGAGFIIAGWAWGWISSGKGPETKDIKEKGLGLLIGFAVLFGIGAIVSAFMAMTGEGGSLQCMETMWNFDVKE